MVSIQKPHPTATALVTALSLLAGVLLFSGMACQPTHESGNIDRFALVNRHNIVVEKMDPLASLTVGNGRFAFTTDITGLQTFYREYEQGVSLGTMSDWGWHSLPNTGNYRIEETYLYHEVEGRQVPYAHQLKHPERALKAVEYFRANPHRLHLGLIRLLIIKEKGGEMEIADVENPTHRLDLWRGEISSQFRLEGEPVEVTVLVHPRQDLVTARIVSPLVGKGRLAVEWLFPYGSAVHTHPGYDFSAPGKHTSLLSENGPSSAVIRRTLDAESYVTTIAWQGKAALTEAAQHRFVLTPAGKGKELEFSCAFSPLPVAEDLPRFEEARKENATHWEGFWSTGGAVDFSECTDPRAAELERRTVLSQYLTRINGSGTLPPQETGLTFNSWFGKFHLEMIWWHSAHYYNWQREEMMAGQLGCYHDFFQKSQDFTRLQGYEGVRWPKMVGPDGQNSPSSVGSYLIWQQPHLIYLAEQLYRARPSAETAEKFGALVNATADFMAGFARYDSTSRQYHLAPPLIPAQELWARETTLDPPFELAYWHWGLTTAQRWRERMGAPANPRWEEVRQNLPAPASDGTLYLGTGNARDSYSNPLNMRDHPMVLGTLGILPLWEKVDPEIMRNTLHTVMDKWDWEHTWGWDYPMVAMCATRLLEPEIALEALLMHVRKNTCLVNGHNYQDERLRIYLPGNGGLLKAVALMCAGWEGCTMSNPGFPKDGRWKVKWENLRPDF